MPSSAARAGTPGRSGRSLQPRAPLVVMATPASTSSTASTVALGSPSSSIECEDDQEHVSLLLHDSNPKRSKNERSTAHDGALRKSSSAHKHNRSQHPSSRSSYKQQHQKQYTRAHADDLECGERTERDANDNSHEWQVLRDLSHCVSTSSDDYALQLVHLRHANFGLRWQQRDSTTAAAPLCVVGPHWWLMASTFTVFTVAAATITTLTAPQAGAGESLTGILLSGACLTMYALVGCVDPGIVPRYVLFGRVRHGWVHACTERGCPDTDMMCCVATAACRCMCVGRIDAPLDDTYSYCDECASYRPEGYAFVLHVKSILAQSTRNSH